MDIRIETGLVGAGEYAEVERRKTTSDKVYLGIEFTKLLHINIIFDLKSFP